MLWVGGFSVLCHHRAGTAHQEENSNQSKHHHWLNARSWSPVVCDFCSGVRNRQDFTPSHTTAGPRFCSVLTQPNTVAKTCSFKSQYTFAVLAFQYPAREYFAAQRGQVGSKPFRRQFNDRTFHILELHFYCPTPRVASDWFDRSNGV